MLSVGLTLKTKRPYEGPTFCLSFKLLTSHFIIIIIFFFVWFVSMSACHYNPRTIRPIWIKFAKNVRHRKDALDQSNVAIVVSFLKCPSYSVLSNVREKTLTFT